MDARMIGGVYLGASSWLLDYLHNLVHRVESQYLGASGLATDRYVVLLISERRYQRQMDIKIQEIRTHNLHLSLPPP